MNAAWIDAAQESALLPETSVLKRSGSHLLIHHPSIDPASDHVTIKDGAYAIIPNPSAEQEGK
jgi:hypothetical protein